MFHFIKKILPGLAQIKRNQIPRSSAHLEIRAIHSMKIANILRSPFFVNSAAFIYIQLPFGPYSCASTVNATVGGWSPGRTVCLTPMLFPKVLNAKQANSMYLFQVFGMT